MSLRLPPIFIEEDLTSFKNFISEKYAGCDLFILTDENAYEKCFPLLSEQVQGKIFHAKIIPSGEAYKTLETAGEIWKFLTENQARRDTLLINLGGGVVTDIGGFCASVYKRGIDFVHIPTTLTAQLDASIGGKTGIDFFGLKNILGTFREPSSIFICPKFLATLPERHIKSGFAEALKHALIADKTYWEELKKFSFQDYSPLIQKSLEIKTKITEVDPFEKNERKLLNFGHTIGHALESFFLEKTPESLLHGEAVAAGMICEAHISFQLGKISETEMKEITQTILSFFSKISLPENDMDTLLNRMHNDKKNQSAHINFTLLESIGKGIINQETEETIIRQSLRYYQSL